MAIVSTQKLTATQAYVLGEASDTRSGELVLQLSGTFSTSFTVNALLRGGAVVSPGTNAAYTIISTGALTAGSTAITAAGIYKVSVPAGCVIVLNNTFTSGTPVVDYYFSPLA